MDISYLFEPYDDLVATADQSFRDMAEEFAECIQCEPHCADCCHAVFGLFLIEAVFLKRDFGQLSEEERGGGLGRGGVTRTRPSKNCKRHSRPSKMIPR